ncbi:MAG: hypothetical protein ACOYES_01100 [Bacillota bacterium]
MRRDPSEFVGAGSPRRAQMGRMIVFLDQSYGIYDIDELADLTGVRLKMTADEHNRMREILKQYDIDFSP